MTKRRVLITGGAGYIGSVLIGYLLEKKYRVTCLDNFLFSDSSRSSLLHFSGKENFDFVFGDVRDKKTIEKQVRKHDVIIPLASIVGAPKCDANPVDAVLINKDAVLHLNNIRSNDQKLIYPTTNSGYGTTTGDVICNEDTPLNPISLYGKTKVETENHLLNSKKDAISLRLATVFGVSPRMRTDLLVNYFVLKAVTDGFLVIYEKNFKRNFSHVEDIARCFEHCIDNYDMMKNRSYNVGLEDANLSKKELAEKIKNHVPKLDIIYKDVGSDPDQRNYVVSNKRLLETGFKFGKSLDEGITELIRCYKIMFGGVIFNDSFMK